MDAQKNINSNQSVKIFEPALRNLRIISAITGEKQYEVMDRLLEKEKDLVMASEQSKGK